MFARGDPGSLRQTASLKGGIDYRRLTPLHAPASYAQTAVFLDVPSAITGSPFVSVVESANSSTQVFQNLGCLFRRYLEGLGLS